MKKLYFLFIFLLVVSACKKEDDKDENTNDENFLNNLEVRLGPNQNIEESDTVEIAIQLKQYVIALIRDNSNVLFPNDGYDSYSFEWNINDETTYTSRSIQHIFQSNGIKKISLSAKYEDDEERIFIFYVDVYGFSITYSDSESYSFFIDESDDLTRTVFTREDNDMIGYEFNNYELISRKILDQSIIYDTEIIEFSKDKNGYLNLWTWNYFYKYDKHADLLFEEEILNGDNAGNIYISNANDYFLVGTNSYRTNFYRFDQNGGNFSTDMLHENNENIISKDGLMLNDSSYIILINNTDNDETSLIRKHLYSGDENTVMIFAENYHRIKNTNEGYFAYELGWGSGLAYFDKSFQLLWEEEFDIDGGWEPLRFREFENSFLIINDNQLISISKSGNLEFIQTQLDGVRFKYKSITRSADNAMILADIRNFNDADEDDYGTIMFIVDKDGNIVE